MYKVPYLYLLCDPILPDFDCAFGRKFCRTAGRKRSRRWSHRRNGNTMVLESEALMQVIAKVRNNNNFIF